jgi:cell division protein FtsQ
VEEAVVSRRGLPVGPPPPPEELIDLALEPTVAESPFLRPKRHARVRPRRRGLSWRLVFALQVAAVALLGVAAAWTAWQKVFASERLRVGKLEVRGSHFLSEGEVRALIGPAVGENILALDIEALKTRLRGSPWVADATVTRTLPDTVRVEIRERVPLALAELDRLYLMDAEGGLIDIYGPRTGAFDLPIVRGLLGVEEESRRERARRAGALLADLGDLGGEVSEVYVLGSGDLKVVLRGAGEVLLFGEAPYRERLLTFLSLRKDLVERAPDAEHFDLRYRGRIYAKRTLVPAPGSAAVAAARPASVPRPALAPPSAQPPRGAAAKESPPRSPLPAGETSGRTTPPRREVVAHAVEAAPRVEDIR